MGLTRMMLDTSAYAAFKLGQQRAIEALRRPQEILVPGIVLGELLAGFEVGTRREQNRQELDAFRQSDRVRVVSITDETAERYATVYAHLRRAGRPIPTNDLWIAASAMEHGAELLTADGHFLHVPQIIVSFLANDN